MDRLIVDFMALKQQGYKYFYTAVQKTSYVSTTVITSQIRINDSERVTQTDSPHRLPSHVQ